MKLLVFSDVHLQVGEAGHQGRQQFIEFLRTIDPDEFGRIVILGDLFDFWFEYKHVIFSGYFEVMRAFADLRDAGVEFDFVCGNHDLWAGRFLESVLGFRIHKTDLRLDLNGTRVLLTHGDGINPKDVGYRIYKRFAQWPWVVAAFRLIHPDWAMRIAQGVSHGSRRMFQSDDLSQGSEVAPLREHAERVIGAGEADVVLSGHCHYPQRIEMPSPSGTGLYINTGDWLFHCTYAVWNGEAFTLHSLDEAENAVTEVVAEHETQRPERQRQT
jgi:UDP-2,3-diacylglucosamine hydrolase